jgi:hypothetical protein
MTRSFRYLRAFLGRSVPMSPQSQVLTLDSKLSHRGVESTLEVAHVSILLGINSVVRKDYLVEF